MTSRLMKTLPYGFGHTLACVIVSLLGVAWVCAEQPQKPSLAAGLATNAPAPEAPIPKSEFISDPKQGKDPFFPRSTRLAMLAAPAKQGTVDSSALVLQGISGPANRRLVIINKVTFEKGEAGEVTMPYGRMRIRCEEIKDESVVVTFGEPPRRLELRLRRGF